MPGVRMPLADFQTSLGLMIRAGNPARLEAETGSLSLSESELASLGELRSSPGLQFTILVQRSWCSGRTSKAAHFTLSILPENLRLSLLKAWVDAGGGTMSFIAAEAAAFLNFLSEQLATRPHERSVCEFEMAALRVAEGVAAFQPPEFSAVNFKTPIRRGRYASVVKFRGNPNTVLKAMVERQTVAISGAETALIFGPGLTGLQRVASQEEAKLFEWLETPSTIEELHRQGWQWELVEDCLRVGVVECCAIM